MIKKLFLILISLILYTYVIISFENKKILLEKSKKIYQSCLKYLKDKEIDVKINKLSKD